MEHQLLMHALTLRHDMSAWGALRAVSNMEETH
jgi:hypothetical protein